MKLYIDQDYKCHVADPAGIYIPVEIDFFDGKCPEYIEGYRYVPAGEAWTGKDGKTFRGEMIAPWKDYTELAQCQAIYERMLAQQADMQAQNAEYEAALTEIEAALGVTAE